MKITRAPRATPTPEPPAPTAPTAPAAALDDDIDAGLNNLLFGIAQAQAQPAEPPAEPVTVTKPKAPKSDDDWVEIGDPLYKEILARIKAERPQTSAYEAQTVAEIVANNTNFQGLTVADWFPTRQVTRVAKEHQHVQN